MATALFKDDQISQVNRIEERVKRLEIQSGPINVAIGEAAESGGTPGPGTITGGGDGQPSQIIAGSIISDMLYSGVIGAYLIHGEHIDAGSITTDHLEAGAITTGIIVADVADIDKLHAEHIAANAITATHIDVVSLDSITGTMGTLTAGKIFLVGPLGESAYIRTAPDGVYPAVQVDGTGVKAFGAAGSGDIKTWIRASDGKIVATGVIIAEAGSNLPASTISGQIATGQIADSAITAVKVGTQAIDVSKLAEHVATSVYATYSNSFEDTTNLNIAGGSIVTASDAQTGTKVARFTGAGGLSTAKMFPYDPNSLYRIRARVRQNLNPTSGSKLYYIGFGCYDSAGVTTGFLYPAAWAGSLTQSSVWTTHTGYIRGIGGVATTGNDPSNPCPVPAGTKFIQPAMYVEWDTGVGGQFDVDLLQVDQLEIPDNVITSAKVYSGTVETLRLQANNIAANAITANKISAIIGGQNLLSNTGFEVTNQDGTFAATPPDWTISQDGTGGVISSVSTPVKQGARAGSITRGATGTYVSAQQSTPVDSVEGGKSYTLTAYVRSQSASRMCRLYLQWYNVSNVLVGTTANTVTPADPVTQYPDVTTDSAVWQRIRLTALAPTGVGVVRCVATVRFFCNSGETFYFDMIQLEEGEVPTQWNPKAVELGPGTITGNLIRTNVIQANHIQSDQIDTTHLKTGAVTANKISIGTISDNLVMNGSFEQTSATNNPAGWAKVDTGLEHATCVTSNAFKTDGDLSLKLGDGVSYNSGAVGQYIAVNPGDTYIFRAKLFHSNGSGTHYMRIAQATSKPSSGTFVWGGFQASNADVPGASGAANTLLTGGFIVREYQYTVPAGVYFISPQFYNFGSSTGYLYVDEVEFRKQIGAVHIEDGAITANKVLAGAIQTQHLSVSIGGANHMPDASFEGKSTGSNVFSLFPNEWPLWSAGVAGYTQQGVNVNISGAGGALPGNGKYAQVAYVSGTDSYMRYIFAGNNLVPFKGKAVIVSAHVWVPASATGTVTTDRTLYVVSDGTGGTSAIPTQPNDKATTITKGTWVRISTKYTVPTNATFLDCRFYSPFQTVGANGTVFWDGIMVEIGDVGPSAYTLFGPDQIIGTQISPGSITTGHISANSITADKLTIQGGGNNLITNATTSFENDTSGWSGAASAVNGTSTISRSLLQSYYGAASLLVTTDGTTTQRGAGIDNIPGVFRAGSKYTLSAWIRPTTALSVRSWVGMAGGADSAEVTTALTANTWTRMVVTWTPSADRTNARIGITTALAVAGSFYVDGVQLEEGDVASAWKQYISPVTIEGGTLTAPVIVGGTVTGSTLQTAAAGQRITLDSTNAIKFYNSSNQNVLQIDPGQFAFKSFATDAFKKIAWQDGSGNAMGQVWGGVNQSGSNSSRLEAAAWAGGNADAISALVAFRQNTAQSVVIAADAKATREAYAQVDSLKVTIIDSSARSQFLQWTGGVLAKRGVEWGSTSATFSGNSQVDVGPLPHSAGTAAVYVFAMGNSAGSIIIPCSYNLWGATTTGITIRVNSLVGNVSGTQGFYYLICT